MNLLDESYGLHRQDEDRFASESHYPSRYVAPQTLDCVHHDRMYASLLPLLRRIPETSWITVGDGRFGADANFLQQHVQSVVATSLSSSTLQIAKKRGWINQYSEENAESLSFDDDSFDFVLCKEAYHHFPRPSIGFYEMLRVARLGVVLIEPFDGSWSPLGALKRGIKKMLRGEHSYDQFEPVGNFIFRLSCSETIKMMTALGYFGVAWKTMNGFWCGPLCDASRTNVSARLLLYWLGVHAQDVACRLRLLPPGLVTMICFKTPPTSMIIQDLKASGFRLAVAPANPYRGSHP